MSDTIDISHISREDKLRMMETLWEDLSRDSGRITSPKWHKKALQETEHRLTHGQEKIIDWEDAKKDLRKLINISRG